MNKKNKPAKQKNNHARAKRRIKLLKLKNFCKRVIESRERKIAKLNKPKGKTITGSARESAYRGTVSYSIFLANKGRRLNQRQKRKLWRQAPHMRKRA
jgi:hypothetical protein